MPQRRNQEKAAGLRGLRSALQVLLHADFLPGWGAAVLRPYSEIVSAGDSRAYSFHYLYYFLERDHGGVAGGGHGQGAVGCAAFYGPLRILAGQETVDQAGGEGIAAAYAVENF